MSLKRAELSNPLFVQQSVRGLLELHLASYSNWVASAERLQREASLSDHHRASVDVASGKPLAELLDD